MERSAGCARCGPKCVAAAPGTGRTVQLHPQEALLQQARALQRSEAFGEYRQRRASARPSRRIAGDLPGAGARWPTGRPVTPCERRGGLAAAGFRLSCHESYSGGLPLSGPGLAHSAAWPPGLFAARLPLAVVGGGLRPRRLGPRPVTPGGPS